MQYVELWLYVIAAMSPVNDGWFQYQNHEWIFKAESCMQSDGSDNQPIYWWKAVALWKYAPWTGNNRRMLTQATTLYERYRKIETTLSTPLRYCNYVVITPDL